MYARFPTGYAISCRTHRAGIERGVCEYARNGPVPRFTLETSNKPLTEGDRLRDRLCGPCEEIGFLREDTDGRAPRGGISSQDQMSDKVDAVSIGPISHTDYRCHQRDERDYHPKSRGFLLERLRLELV